ncbi:MULTISPECIES: hypothetical protein [Vibrio]|nr:MULTISPECIES: hypothetical protein [Vibrio]
MKMPTIFNAMSLTGLRCIKLTFAKDSISPTLMESRCILLRPTVP